MSSPLLNHQYRHVFVIERTYCGEDSPPEEMEIGENPDRRDDTHRISKTDLEKTQLSAELKTSPSPGEELGFSTDWARPGERQGVPGNEALFKSSDRIDRGGSKAGKGGSKAGKAGSKADKESSKKRSRREAASSARWSSGGTWNQRGKTLEPWEKAEPWNSKPWSPIYSQGDPYYTVEPKRGKASKPSSWRKGILSGGEQCYKSQEPKQERSFSERNSPSRRTSHKAPEFLERRESWKKGACSYANVSDKGKAEFPNFNALLEKPFYCADLPKPNSATGADSEWGKGVTLTGDYQAAKEQLQAELLLKEFQQFLELKSGKHKKPDEENNCLSPDECMQIDNDVPTLSYDPCAMDCSLCFRE